VALVNNFKDSLKTEVGLFLEQIFLRIVESENSSYQHKLLVLQVLYRVTLLPKATLEFFLNYDCDMEEKDVFARMIESLAKIAMGRHSKSDIFPPAQDANLRSAALETLANIVTQQVAWMDSESTSFNRSDSLAPAELEETVITETSEPYSTDKIEQLKQMKLNLNKAVAKFNMSSSSGMKYFIACGYVQPDNPTEICNLLKTTPGLSKSMIGDYLGENKPINLRVLYEFIDSHSFVGLNLVEAIRMFLSSFRLPGESQKIDRMMEKFAEKYCKDNPSTFGTADTCYVLSYAVIMLQTDLNNPCVKNKMTLDGFRRINEGINQGANLDPGFLEEIYNAVKNSPFKLMEDEVAAMRLVGANSSKQRQDLFEKEGELIVKQSQEMFKRHRKTSVYIHANDVDQIRPMFEAIWHPLLACFSVLIEETTDLRELRLCLQGMYASIKIAARFNMTIELESFISSLAKFTSLIYKHNQINEKNLECVKTLLQVARIEANYLRASWLHILMCLSRLDYLHLISDSAAHGRHINELELWNSESIQSINPAEIDSIFNMSSGLDDEAVIEFVRQLVEVSKEELWSASPRIFSLQALVSVASINMDRIRVVWARIWAILKDHFTEAGLHSDSKIAVFCIDSLKQLAVKFLSKEELSNFNFQKDFLAPFEAMMKRSTHPEVREMVVACMHHIVFAKSNKIKSGWHSILEVMSVAGQDSHRSIVACACEALHKLVTSEHDVLEENFSELVNAVFSCSKSKFEDLALNSLQLVLHISRALPNLPSHLWFVMLSGLTPRLQDPRVSLRAQSLNILFELLQKAEFDQEQWKVIYNAVILPIFDDAQISDDAWIIGTFKEALLGLLSLLVDKWDDLSFLTAGIIELLSTLVESCKDVLAKVAIEVLKELLVTVSSRFAEADWDLLSQKYAQALRATTPAELLTQQKSPGQLPFDAEICMSKCLIQIYLINHLNEILGSKAINWTSEQLYFVVEALRDSYELAHEFNRQTERRYALWQDGFRFNSNSLPELIRQEREGLSLYLRQLFTLLRGGLDVENELIEAVRRVLIEFSVKDRGSSDLTTQEQAEWDREVKMLTPLVSKIILPELTQHAKLGLSKMRLELLGLISCNSSEVRVALQALLAEALA
jgi:Sec7-like guanine-nucleotide exchange factor